MPTASHGSLAAVFGALALLLIAARIGGHVATRFRLPTVLGELVAGLLLGAIGGRFLAFLHDSPVLNALGELGALLLLFEVGLESDLAELRKVGARAVLVATIGVVTPFALGAAVSALLQRGALYEHLFVGATLAATSVGITARVLRDLGRMQTLEARIILGAAVADDVLGLLLLGLLAALVRAENGATHVSLAAIALLLARALGFLAGAVLLGRLLVPRLARLAARLRGKDTLLVVALSLCLALSFGADRFGLAPPIGAFLAGLLLRPSDWAPLAQQGEGELAEKLEPLSAVFVPLFFVLAGARVDLRLLADPRTAVFALVLTAAAVVGKLAAGLGARGKGVNAWVVGVGMVPRGEVGLIFAAVGSELTLRGEPVLSRATFSAVVAMVALTSLLPPPLLARAFRERPARARGNKKG